MDDDALDELRGRLTRLEHLAADPGPSAGQQPADPEDLATFVDWLTDTYWRAGIGSSGGPRWCDSWDQHPEAVARLTALQRAHDTLTRDDGAGASTWHLQHLDPTLDILTSRSGPFAQCTPAEPGGRPARHAAGSRPT